VTTAQLKAWIGVHRGDIDELSADLERTQADTAMARTMLYRRRATVAKVISEFFGAVGKGFGPYLANRAPQAPVNVAREIEEAKNAASIIAPRYEHSAPLLFERAALAEMEGRHKNARLNLTKSLRDCIACNDLDDKGRLVIGVRKNRRCPVIVM